jgi:glycosyltransferase involved in cell wall biosynthesis
MADEFVRLGLDPGRIRVQRYGFVPFPVRTKTPHAGRVRIGFVGTLVWHKGVHVLLDAVRLLPPDSFELTIHGDPNVFPPYVEDLRRRAAQLPVRFAGAFDQEQAAQAYAAMDVLVVPSLWLENSPLVIQEAFMCGVPVIGARIGGIPELVDDQVNGRLYRPDSSADLAGVLRQVIQDPSVLDAWQRALPAARTIEEDASGWSAIYGDCLARPRNEPVLQ